MDAERLFDDVPQDIEWAVADDVCWLLQSRPITHLPPAPLEDVRWEPPTRGTKLIRRQIVENMPDPLSPLFAELYLTDGLDQSMDRFLADLGAPIRFDDIIERPFFVTVNGFAYCRADYRLSWRLLWILPRILSWYARSLKRLMKDMVPRWRDEGLPAYLAVIAEWRTVDPDTAMDAQLLNGMRALALADATYWFHVAMVMGIAKLSDGLLNAFLTSRLVPGNLTSGVFLRGFPSKTLEAQQELEAVARRIRAEPALRDWVIATPADRLLDALPRQSAGDAVRADIQQYLDTYGHTIYTLDFAQPTQAENPLPVLLSLKALVADGDYDITARQTAMVREREQQEQATSASLGRMRRWLFRKLLGWARAYGPHREEALFFIGAAWPTLRRLARELGRRLVAAGALSKPDDVFYLETRALEAACAAGAAGRAPPEFARQAAEQRALRQARMSLHPPGMVPERSRWKVGSIDMSTWETQKRNALDADTLDGFAVSPGKVTAPASVILSPADFSSMQPNTILVCPTTTPAWTPLFTQAIGLVTDIGGVLAHGSIVAREYGIPAVMGTGNVTQRIVTGQQITVDGDTGTVAIGK
jgi:pyruvate,water dikinase